MQQAETDAIEAETARQTTLANARQFIADYIAKPNADITRLEDTRAIKTLILLLRNNARTE